MDTQAILKQLREERQRIDAAILALEALNGAFSSPAVAPKAKAPVATTKSKRGGKRRMSAAGRKAISEAAKKRWARIKAIGSVKAPKAAGGAKKASKKASKKGSKGTAEKVPF